MSGDASSDDASSVMPSSARSGSAERGRIVIADAKRITSEPSDALADSIAWRSVPAPESPSDVTLH